MKKTFIIMGGLIIGIILLVIGLIVLDSIDTSVNKLVCKSSSGNITLKYNEDGLVGYSIFKINFDYDKEKSYAAEVGIDAYLEYFEDWFTSNTSGSCFKQ